MKLHGYVIKHSIYVAQGTVCREVALCGVLCNSEVTLCEVQYDNEGVLLCK